MSRFSDSESPSSLSLIYRGTVHEDSDFMIQFIANPDYEMGMASLKEDNIQVGIKIYDQGYKLQSNKMPDECPKKRQAWMDYGHHH